MVSTLVFNGWAAGPEAWEFCTFRHDWVFSYLEQMEGLAERVFADAEAAVLVGFSMGGMTALRLLAAAPEKVKGLVLVSSTPRMSAEPETGWRGMGPRRLKAFLYATRLVFAHDPSPLYAPDNLQRGLDFLDGTDLRPALEGLPEGYRRQLPVAVVHSERDAIVSPQNAGYFRQLFPNARVTMVSGTEHTLSITAPAVVDAAVASVFRACRRAAKDVAAQAPRP